MVAHLAARSCGDIEVTGSNPTIRWETFGLNLQTRSSRISRIPPKVGPDQPVVYTKKNQIIWDATSTGMFTVRSAWELIRTRSVSFQYHSFCWHKYLPSKISVFLWRMLHKA